MRCSLAVYVVILCKHKDVFVLCKILDRFSPPQNDTSKIWSIWLLVNVEIDSKYTTPRTISDILYPNGHIIHWSFSFHPVEVSFLEHLANAREEIKANFLFKCGNKQHNSFSHSNEVVEAILFFPVERKWVRNWIWIWIFGRLFVICQINMLHAAWLLFPYTLDMLEAHTNTHSLSPSLSWPISGCSDCSYANSLTDSLLSHRGTFDELLLIGHCLNKVSFRCDLFYEMEYLY